MTQPVSPLSSNQTVRPRHVPERTCAACRRKAAQGDLVRLSKSEAGQWVLGVRGGRGVYLCHNSACWQEKRLRRTFGAQAARVSELFSLTQ